MPTDAKTPTDTGKLLLSPEDTPTECRGDLLALGRYIIFTSEGHIWRVFSRVPWGLQETGAGPGNWGQEWLEPDTLSVL